MTHWPLRTSYHDIILGHGQPQMRGRYTHKNFWGGRSRFRHRSIRFDKTVIEPHDTERSDKKRWYLGRGDSGLGTHCQLCAALYHPFHKRRDEWRTR